MEGFKKIYKVRWKKISIRIRNDHHHPTNFDYHATEKLIIHAIMRHESQYREH